MKPQSLFPLAAAFFAGFYSSNLMQRCPSPPPPPPLRSAFEERGPPTKQELGQAGWTLLHTIAANQPEQPTAEESQRMMSFLQALGHVYPCATCASHFRQHYTSHPIDASSRTAISMWVCEAHNEVNVRNGKEPFYCDMGVLDARWKDCGCDKATNQTMTSQQAASSVRSVVPRSRTKTLDKLGPASGHRTKLRQHPRRLRTEHLGA